MTALIYFVKLYLFILIILFMYLLFIACPDNLLCVLIMVTPYLIIPEWYFLYIYILIRCILCYISNIILVCIINFTSLIFRL